MGKRILVTGSTGFLGREIVSALVARGYSVRALTRDPSKSALLSRLGAEPVVGDIVDAASIEAALTDIELVIHAAADTVATAAIDRSATVQGTDNVLRLCRAKGVERLVYISSCAVYDVAGAVPESRLAEDSRLEPYPERRGLYSWAKFEADRRVLNFMRESPVATVCLRPGTIYGAGGPLCTPMLGLALPGRFFAVIGNGEFVLPLVYIDNLVEAVMLALTSGEAPGQVYNVVDPECVDKRRYMKQLVRQVDPAVKFFYLPYRLLYFAVAGQEVLFRCLGRAPFLTRYRLASSQRPVVYDSTKIQNELGWRQHVAFSEAVQKISANLLTES